MSKVCGLFLLFLLIAACASAQQTGTGAVQGTVRDATKAVITNARVELSHSATARKYETTSSEIGFYLFPALPLGNYTISVAAAGMQTWQGDFVLSVGQTAVIDPVLNVGATMTEVTVAGDVTPLVTLSSPTTSNVLERARIEQLPLNGRFIQNLIMTVVPGLEGGAQAPRVTGLSRGAMEFVQDGTVLGNRDQENLEISTRPPGMDTVAEFRVETSVSSAKMSAPATTIISTKSGTNQIHGALFETARNSAVGVARRRQDYYAKPPHLVRNEFGASVGGPVYLPKVYNGKNRTFFFFAYEAYRNLAGTTLGTTMPTMAMRGGDFSGLVDSQGRKYTLYDPWSTNSSTWQRQPYPNNVIPKTLMSPMYKYLMSVTPAPTFADVNPLVSNNFFGPAPNNQRDNTETMRIDHNFSDHDQVFGRFSIGKSLQTQYEATNNVPVTLDASANIINIGGRDLSSAFSWTHTFSPTFFSQTLVTDFHEDWLVASSLSTANNLVDQLGLPNPSNDPMIANFTRNTGFGMIYKTQEGRHNITQVTVIEQNFTKVHGRHELQFGGKFRHEKVNALADRAANYNYFASNATSLYDPSTGSAYGAVPFTGHDSANFYLGLASQYDTQIVRGWNHMRQREYNLYFQDNFKVNSRLTLNLGLRYELFEPPKDRDNLAVGFDLKSKTVVDAISLDQMYKLGATSPAIVDAYKALGVKFGSAQDFGLPSGLLRSNFLDFGPRLGFAYRLGSAGKRAMVLRGGYGVYGYATYTRTWTRFMRLNPPLSATRSISYTSAAQSPDGLPNYLLRSVPTVVAGVNSRDVLSTAASNNMTPGMPTVYFFDPDQPTSRAHEWNFTLEREIMNNVVARAGYVGTHGSRLDQYYQYNEGPVSNYVWFVKTGLPLPTGTYANTAMRGYDQTTYGSVNEYMKSGWSNGSSARLELERRYSNGYGFQLFYVMTNAFRAGGNAEYDGYLTPADAFLPGAVPQDDQARNRFLNYCRDTAIPKHRVRWNWIVDLPFGKGKKFAGGAGGLLDRVIGGWQLAGSGTLQSRYVSLPTGYYASLGKLEIYGTKYPIQDCRSGQCYPGYLYFNGYIPANRINSVDANGKPNGVMGVPANYKPIGTPLFPTPANGGSASDPNYKYYETNTVWVPLKNGTLQQTTLNDGLHPWRNQFWLANSIWNLDASLFKSIRITESFTGRFNADFFNVLNMPGMGTPNSSSGIISLQSSSNTARILQLTLRLTW